MTHAFFKALLFLAAGSVIIAMHHEQDMRKMGGLRKYMPITYWTCLIGALALIGFPGFSGFFSKDALIEAVERVDVAGARYAYWCVLIGVFVTAFYTFRLVFMTFHGKERMDEHTREHLHESPWVVTLPLVLLAIPSVVIGWLTIGPLLFGDYFGDADPRRASPRRAARGSARSSMARGPSCCTAWRSPILGWRPPASCWPGSCTSSGRSSPGSCASGQAWLYTLLENKYYFDAFNENVIAGGSRALGNLLWRGGDVAIIDGAAVNGSARARRLARRRRARRAVRLPLPLRLRDDHRPLGAARVAPLGEADPCKLTGPS